MDYIWFHGRGRQLLLAGLVYLNLDAVQLRIPAIHRAKLGRSCRGLFLRFCRFRVLLVLVVVVKRLPPSSCVGDKMRVDTDGRTDGQTDGHYQVHYLPVLLSHEVDKNVKYSCFGLHV